MAILAGDIKLVASQVMDDVDEGGGAPTSTVIQDGTSNSLFNDISELDRAGGRVNLRKVFASVQTDNRDTYLGGNVIVADPPDDPNVSVTIFKASATFDKRTDAQDRIEAYLNKGPAIDGYLFENHITGQRAVQIFQRESAELPTVGGTIYLVMDEELPTEYYQYVRVTRVTSEVRAFTYDTGSDVKDYTARVVTCELSDALRYDFPGSPASRLYTQNAAKTKIRDVVVADAATYYGATKVATTAAIGDLTVAVESVYTKLVPSAQTETALVDKPLSGDVLPMVATAAGTLTRTHTATIAPLGMYVTPTGIWPGSLTLTWGGTVVTDDGVGNVLISGAVVGTVVYSTGIVTFNASAPSTTSTMTETYRPAAGVSMQSYTLFRPVTAETRSYVWVIPLLPTPSPGSVRVSFMAQGNWYELTDNGLGALNGAQTGQGVGTINYVTGTISVTLGALPDVGSQILVAWGTHQEFINLSDSSLAIEEPKIEFDLGGAVAPGTVSLTWTNGGARTVTDNGTSGLVGDGTGEINYSTGKGWFRTAYTPGSDLSVDYETGGAETYGVTVGDSVTWSGTLPNAPIKPKSVSFSFLMLQASAVPDEYGRVPVSSELVPAVVRDDGAGGLELIGYGPLVGSSINYTTGAVVMPINYNSVLPIPQYENVSVPPYMIATYPN